MAAANLESLPALTPLLKDLFWIFAVLVLCAVSPAATHTGNHIHIIHVHV